MMDCEGQTNLRLDVGVHLIPLFPKHSATPRLRCRNCQVLA